MSLEIKLQGTVRTAEARREGEGWRLRLDGVEPTGLEILAVAGDRVTLRRDGRRLEAWVARRGAERHVFLDGRAFVLHAGGDEVGDHAGAEAGGPRVVADMPGRVVQVLAAVGDRVDAGTPLLILEAMKMETEVAAPVAGRVREVAAVTGATVALGDLLVEIEPEAEEA